MKKNSTSIYGNFVRIFHKKLWELLLIGISILCIICPFYGYYSYMNHVSLEQAFSITYVLEFVLIFILVIVCANRPRKIGEPENYDRF